MEPLYRCPDCNLQARLINRDGYFKCDVCWEAEDSRLKREQEERRLHSTGLTSRCLASSLTQLATSLPLGGRIACLKLMRWLQVGGGCYLFGPSNLRDKLARAAAAEIYRSQKSLKILTEADYLDIFFHDRAARQVLSRVPWLCLLDVGMHASTRPPGQALLHLLRQRKNSYHATGTLFVSHRSPHSQAELLTQALDDTRHAADLFRDIFANNAVCTLGGLPGQSARLFELSPEAMGAWQS